MQFTSLTPWPDPFAGVEIVIGTPGRLADLLAAGATTLARVTMAVVDEADQVPILPPPPSCQLGPRTDYWPLPLPGRDSDSCTTGTTNLVDPTGRRFGRGGSSSRFVSSCQG